MNRDALPPGAEANSTSAPDDEEGDPIVINWRARLPGVLLCLLLVGLWLHHLPQGPAMLEWAISAQSLRAGEYGNILLHMFAHGGLIHLLLNVLVLFALSGPIQYRMGADAAGYGKFLVFYLLSGLAGLALYLALHPDSAIPMLGASGAIYGLVGFVIRWPPAEPLPDALTSREARTGMLSLLKANLVLIAVISLPALLTGRAGGLAWESHLGGFAFGLLAAPGFGRRGNPGPGER